MQPGHRAGIEPAQGPSVDDPRARAAALIGDRRMEDAAALLAHGRRLHPDDAHLLLDQASLAEATGDRDGAIEMLQAAIDRHPAAEAAYLRAGRLCRQVDRAREAETVLLEGMCRFPANMDLAAEYAAIAEDRQDWGQAARRYHLARERFPSQIWTHARLAAALRNAKRLAEAEEALLEGYRHVPHDRHFLTEHAEVAADREDWAEAARRFDTARERYPGFWWTCKRHADVLKRAGGTMEAEAVLAEGQRLAPGEPVVFLDHAELAFDRRDWAESLRRFGTVKDRFPGEWWPYKRIADTLRATGRGDEAESVLLEGQRLFPGEPALFVDHAELAVDRRDWAESLRRFGAARDRFPDAWWSYKRIADTLLATDRAGEAEAALLEGQRRAPGEPGLFIDHAQLAFNRRDWAESLRRFEIARDRFPGMWWPYKRIADTLRATGRADEAEAALLEGQRQVPGEPALFIDHAELAFDRRDWAESLQRFEAVRERFPQDWRSYRRIAAALRATGRAGEAEAVLLDGQGRHPQQPDLFLDHADLAAAARDWPEALLRFEDARARFPGLWPPLREIALTYRKMERFADAERVIREGLELFPDEPEVMFAYADHAQWVGEVDEAIERYRAIRERYPHSHLAHFRLACSVGAARRLDEAEAMLIEVMKAFPEERSTLTELVQLTIRLQASERQMSTATLEEMVDDWIRRCGDAEDLLVAKAELAQINGDYQGYLQRLLHLARVHPGAKAIERKITAARELLLGRGELVADEPGVAASPPGPEDASRARRTLLGLFESLGGGGPGGIILYGCEFGFLQRQAALEPLSLLRWTGVNLANVTRLLANDFEGIAELGNCVLDFAEDAYDWHFIDTAYGLRCDHTHLDRLTVRQEDALQMMCQRFRFLARKLREDLEDGEKVFVYRYLGSAPDEAEVLALAEAVNGYGRNMLLFVCRADADHPPLTVRLVHPGLMVGHIDWFAPDRHHYPDNLEGWTRICEQAHNLWQGQTAG